MSPLRRGLLLATISSVIFGVMGIALLLEGDASTARSTFAVGVIVAATSGASVIYQVERWSLSAQSTIHLTVMLCTVLPALFLSGWHLCRDRARPLAGDVLGVRGDRAEASSAPGNERRPAAPAIMNTP